MLNKRPFLKEFLLEMAKHYNLVIFTASYREYAEKILNIFDPRSELIVNVLTRENCTKYNNSFIKDFRVVANSNIQKEDMLMLDNKAISFAYNIFQGIPILPYYDDPNDSELKDIIPFLVRLADPKVDIKAELKERYKYDHVRLLTFHGGP